MHNRLEHSDRYGGLSLVLHNKPNLRPVLFSMGVLIVVVLLNSCDTKLPADVEQARTVLPESIDFNLHVRPILSDRCFACHGPDANKREADLRLDTEEGALQHLLSSGAHAIVPGSLRKSEAIQRILSADPEVKMPPPASNLSLTATEIAILTAWVEQGAAWKPHWAYIPVEKPDIPVVAKKEWPVNAIDYFVLHRLEKEDLQPQIEAEKETLLRRVTFDLTGLPPTPEETEAFLADTSGNAYEKVVDRLLASPHYGEQMAVGWMDLARFADTHGYTVDRYRDMSPWRDWVIKAFNENMPYDQFVTWQLAGDLLPGATREQILATGFNRNHAQNAEGGIINEEFRVEYVADRTQTFGTAFLGLTLQCARCHDHKYDAISQKEYYQLSSFFNNVDESGQISWDDAMPVPTLMLTDSAQEAEIAFLREQIRQTEEAIEINRKEKQPAFQDWLQQRKKNVISQPAGMVGRFALEKATRDRLSNAINPRQGGMMIDPVTQKVAEEDPVLTEGKTGKGVLLNGDDALYFPDLGIYSRAEPFSIGLWVKVPDKLIHGVIFHKNEGGIIYNFRGYQLSIEDNLLDVRLSHTFPYNAIHAVSTRTIPKEKWVHLLLTYDGSSKASGVHLYMNGNPVVLEVKRDNLYKDLLFNREKEPGLKVGARWRSKGLTQGVADEIVVFDRELTAIEAAQLAGKDTLHNLLSMPYQQLSHQQQQALYEYYLHRHDAAHTRWLHALKSQRKQRNAIEEQVQEVMVMDEMKTSRQAYLLDRGVYDAHGEPVEPATPKSVKVFPDTLPDNRLGLAQWLTSADHPLFARVTVNRYWQSFFGRGIVNTPEDFGNQGELPSHPLLLDWLAGELMDSGWNIKHMQKLIVMSATYRQSSTTSEVLRQKDPENMLLARGPAQRLTAEMLRDQALAVSNLLVRKIGGPSVKPYQPEGLWEVNGATYVQDTGENLYRRSLYNFWKRTVPPPTMNMFDAPTRAYCEVKRQKTSTPLQALALLNDPQFLEAARVAAEKVVREKSNAEEQIQYAYRLLTARYPSAQEVDLLQALYESKYKQFEKYPGRAQDLLATGAYPIDHALDPAKVASCMVVISTVMNFDASVTKR